MPVFQYSARDNRGQIIRGQTEAQNQAAVIRLLREQGLIPTTVEAGATRRAARRAMGKGGKIKLEDLVILTRQFATMIRAGLPLIEVLNILSEQTEKRALKAVMKQVERDVETGSSLNEAMSRHPKVFSTFYLSMIAAGEAAGMLDSILDQIALYLEKVVSIQRKVKSAVMYPSVVSVVAIGITVFLLIKVVPVFGDIFSDMGGKLPAPTRITMGISNFLQDNFLLSVFILIGLALLVWQGGRTPKGRRILDQLKLKMPIFGPLFLKVAVARFTRTLGTLIHSGVNILAALDIVARTAGNVVIEEAVVKTRASIQSGESLAAPLRDSQVFPPMVVRMIDVGERTGALESMLTKIADFYEDQVDAAVSGLTSMIEPLLIVFLGVVVGFIVISMFMPMFKMIELVG
ncbi:MAG TPA: type II secretion system F family protein [Candidatus Sumerlaeota bacterium]|nr:type II secretion system F family protein [Candidatus Sumerlaeota bacterium]HOR28664.1 type II secretion system F family protein [Candidatus Sumerlaeota bacterium]HPK01681.1 type II secretion system F family protein [Candidatus Sumerlaeota bacterium]